MKQGWKTCKFADVFDLQMGKTPSRDNPTYWGDDNMWVSIADMNEQKYMSATKEGITDVAVQESGIKPIPKGTVIMSFKLSIGKVSIATSKLYTNEAIMGFIEKEEGTLVPEYLYYYLKGYKWEGANKAAMGMTLNKKTIAENTISYPPIAEQEKIVAELDCLSGIIEKKKQQLKELDNLAQSIFYEMFSNQDGTPVKLSQACSVVSGLVNPNDEPYCNYPHIGGANIESHTGKFVNVKLAKEENLISGKYPFDDTMILYSKIRPNLNKVALPSFKGICSADMYPLIPQKEFDKVFLKYILTQKVFLDYAISHSGRANIPKINREDLLNYEFLTYPITLQQDFASKIESIEKQKELIAQSIKETETLFNSRMDYYFG